MGIHNLMKLMGDFAPTAIKECEIKNYFGRKVAIDASMSLYQFLIAVRADGNMLTDDDGETTSHLVGMFYRTIRYVSALRIEYLAQSISCRVFLVANKRLYIRVCRSVCRSLRRSVTRFFSICGIKAKK